MRTRSVAVGLALAMLTQACAGKKAADSAALGDSAATVAGALAPPAELQARADALIQAWNQDDASVVAAFFTSAAVAMTPDSTYRGAREIETRWLEPGLPALSELAVSERAFTGAGDSMSETGKFSYNFTVPKQPVVVRRGSYRTAWVRDGGEWKVAEVSLSADSASAPATTTTTTTPATAPMSTQ